MYILLQYNRYNLPKRDDSATDKNQGIFSRSVCSEWQSAKINVHTAAAMVTMISRRYVLRDGWVPSVGL